MPLRTARDVDLTDRVSDCTGLGCVSTLGPFHSNDSIIKQFRGSAECPASSGMILAAASHTKNASPGAISPFLRLGVVLVSNSSNSSNRESEGTSCMPCLPCSSCSISCSPRLLATRLVQCHNGPNRHLENEFQFQDDESYAGHWKTSRGNFTTQGLF